MSHQQYDELARHLCDRLGADAVVIAIVNGTYGTGASRVERAITRMPRSTLRGALIKGLKAMIAHIEHVDLVPPTNPNTVS